LRVKVSRITDSLQKLNKHGKDGITANDVRANEPQITDRLLSAKELPKTDRHLKLNRQKFEVKQTDKL
jgi:hypothetical protein